MYQGLRGDPFITFAPRGVANFANDSTDRLHENANKGGVQNSENFANVINECPLISYGAKSSEGRGRASCYPSRQPFKVFLSEETLILKIVRQKG